MVIEAVKWLIDHKGTISTVLLTGGGIAKGLMVVYKKLYKPVKKLISNIEKIDYLSGKVDGSLYINPHPIFISNEKNEVTFVNAAWLEMTEMTDAKQALGMGWMSAIPDEDKERMEEIVDRYTKYPSEFKGIVTFKGLVTGKIVKANCRTNLIRDEENNIIMTFGLLQILH